MPPSQGLHYERPDVVTLPCTGSYVVCRSAIGDGVVAETGLNRAAGACSASTLVNGAVPGPIAEVQLGMRLTGVECCHIGASN